MTPAAGPAQAVAPPAQPKFMQELDTLIRARYPLVYLVCPGGAAAGRLLKELAQTHGKAL